MPESPRSTLLPEGSAPEPVPLPHFPDRLHAFVWRNWQLVPLSRLAQVVGATPDEIRRLGKTMELPDPRAISREQQRRSHLTVIKRNWHLLPYEQLLALLDWTPEQLAYTLQEDDFLFIKLGRLKPRCEPLRYGATDEATQRRAAEIAALAREEFGREPLDEAEPLFEFVSHLSDPPPGDHERPAATSGASEKELKPRYCYSYFALYGDPLLETEADSYPDGYLARLAQVGVDGVWLQAVLYNLAEFPWDPELSARREERLENLRALIARARCHGIGIYLYLNEPRTMPLAFFETHPELKGIEAGDWATLCTSHPAVQEYLTGAVESICGAAPGLAGFFTITASENLTNCWSHHRGLGCPRCAGRGAAEVIAEVNALFREGIRRAGSEASLIAWDWGWTDEAAEGIIRRLPTDVALMSVSEWSLPIRRGGVETSVGEYSISAVGPGPRALRHWAIARERGLKTMAKIQAGNTWELSAVPYIPAVENVARHVANLREAGVEGLMLGWTLGGYPSPNLEIANCRSGEGALEAVARRRFGEEAAADVVRFWKELSAAFSEFPYHGGTVYNAPLQVGPANLLWETPTGYRATMVGFPYDDVNAWRSVYPADVFAAQLERVADGFNGAIAGLQGSVDRSRRRARSRTREAFEDEHDDENQNDSLSSEVRIAEAAALHFRSVANQVRFVLARDALAAAGSREEAAPHLEPLERLLKAEIEAARRLRTLQQADSRIGFEASNQYYYVPLDLLEKILNCRDLLARWLPAQRARWRPER